MTKLDTQPIASAVTELVARLLARRADADALADQLQSGAASWRVVIDARSGVLALAFVNGADRSSRIIDSLQIEPADPDAGISVDAWIEAKLAGQPTH